MLISSTLRGWSVPTKVPMNMRPSVIDMRIVSRKRPFKRCIDGVFRCVGGDETVDDGGDGVDAMKELKQGLFRKQTCDN